MSFSDIPIRGPGVTDPSWWNSLRTAGIALAPNLPGTGTRPVVASSTGILSAPAIAEFDNGNSGSTKTIDWSQSQAEKVTLTANCTFTFSNPAAGESYVLKVVQDSTTRTAAWPGTVKWPGGVAPVISAASGAIDVLTFYYDGTNYFGAFSQAYA